LGASDGAKVRSEVGSIFYSSIRASSVWKDVDMDQASSPIPPEPNWLQESKRTKMRDGTFGWVSFLA